VAFSSVVQAVSVHTVNLVAAIWIRMYILISWGLTGQLKNHC